MDKREKGGGGTRSVGGEGGIGREEKGSWGGEKWRLIWRYRGSIKEQYKEKNDSPSLSSNLFSPHSSSLSSPNFALSLFFYPLSHLASSFSSCSASFSLLSISLLSIFLHPLLLFSPLPSHLLPLSPSFLLFSFPSDFAPSLYSLLPSLFFIPSDSYYFSFFLLILLSFSYSFLHAFSSSLSSTSSFLLFLSLSSFFYSSYSPSLLHSPSPFPHHSLLHFPSSLLMPPYPPLIRPLLILLFFFLFSFHLFLFFRFSCLPLFHPLFLFLSPHSSPLFPPSSFLFIHFFYILSLFFLLSLSLIPSPSSLRPYFILLHLSSPFSNHSLSQIYSIFFISLCPPLIRSLLVFLFFHFSYILFFISFLFSLCLCFLSFISLLIFFAPLIDSSSFPLPFSNLSPLFLLCILLSFSYVNFSSSPSFSSTFSSSCSFFFSPPPYRQTLRRSRVLENGHLERILNLLVLPITETCTGGGSEGFWPPPPLEL